MGLMSRKGTFYCRLISAYSPGCGLMSALAECVLIQALCCCQVLARGPRCRHPLPVAPTTYLILADEEFVFLEADHILPVDSAAGDAPSAITFTTVKVLGNFPGPSGAVCGKRPSVPLHVHSFCPNMFGWKQTETRWSHRAGTRSSWGCAGLQAWRSLKITKGGWGNIRKLHSCSSHALVVWQMTLSCWDLQFWLWTLLCTCACWWLHWKKPHWEHHKYMRCAKAFSNRWTVEPWTVEEADKRDWLRTIAVGFLFLSFALAVGRAATEASDASEASVFSNSYAIWLVCQPNGEFWRRQIIGWHLDLYVRFVCGVQGLVPTLLLQSTWRAAPVTTRSFCRRAHSKLPY